MNMNTMPYVGAVVHFVKPTELMPGPKHMAAMIIDICDNGNVNLVLFPNTTSLAGTLDVAFDLEKKPNTWHWVTDDWVTEDSPKSPEPEKEG